MSLLSQGGITCHSEIMSQMFPYLPVPMHSPHWHRYNGLGDRTNDIPPPPPPHSASVLLSKTWLCVTLYALASAPSLDPFTTVSDSIDIHPQACASLPTSVLLFFTPLIYHRWRGHDGVIDPWKARCPPDGGGGGGGVRESDCSSQLLSGGTANDQESGQLLSVTGGDGIDCDVVLCPWQPQRGGLLVCL